MNYKSKFAVVTGGVSGIGRCIAEVFLHVGADVAVIDVDKAEGEEFQGLYPDLRFFHGDIGDKSALEGFVKALRQPVDFLVNNACVGRKGLLSECSWEDFEYVQRVGVTAPYYLASLLLKGNMLAPNAAIVNIASTRAFQSQEDTESYTAAKGGIVALTHAMAVSLAGKARVNSVSPGWIDVGMYHKEIKPGEHSAQDHAQHPAKRMGKAEDIAGIVLYLCGDQAEFITGENITVDGGMSKLMVYHGDFGWRLG
ncbi:MAG: SDR family oxidoreductase [Chitinispirillales bacterium]|nr:SDR family oxidoreductase [Chitinispirillales bacterium]